MRPEQTTGLLERLHAIEMQFHTVMSQKQAGLVRGHSGRVALNRPFVGAEQVEPLHRRENALPLLQTEDRGVPPPKKTVRGFSRTNDQLHHE